MSDKMPIDFEREKWLSDLSIRERKLKLKEQEAERLERELELKEREAARSRWSSPLIIAIIAAAVAGGGNAAVALLNGHSEQIVEDRRAEADRILEAIKTGDVNNAAINLQFLLNVGLIRDMQTVQALKAFLATRKPGKGPSLPVVNNNSPSWLSQLMFTPPKWSSRRSISFQSEPPGAMVSVGDDQIGRTPMDVLIPAEDLPKTKLSFPGMMPCNASNWIQMPLLDQDTSTQINCKFQKASGASQN